jgi:hypothetical protein
VTVTIAFVDGSEARLRELAWFVPALAVELAHLPAGYATAAPDPAGKARDKLLAMGALPRPAFAEATDLTTLDGKSLQLELDSENENRFCRWWREKPVRFHLALALRRGTHSAGALRVPSLSGGSGFAVAGGADIELFVATADGVVAEKPTGARHHSWERLFVPAEWDSTLAVLLDTQTDAGPRAEAYAALLAAVTG